MRQKIILIAVALFTFVNYSFAQKDQKKLTPLTADSLASGNYKDVFKSFFQLALNKFTSNNKEIQFTSNPFAVMAKMDSSLLIDTNYYRLRHLRYLNFSFAGKLDSSYRFNGFSSGIKYSLINKRDETVSREFITANLIEDSTNSKANNSMNAFQTSLPIGDERKNFRAIIDSFIRGRSQYDTFDKLDSSFRKKFIAYLDSTKNNQFLLFLKLNPNFNFNELSKRNYDKVKAAFQNKVLWTAEISDTTYKDHFFLSNLVLTTQFLKGVLKPQNAINVQLDIKATAQLVDDSLLSGRDLKRGILIFEPGVNILFKNKQTQKSWAEFKMNGSFTNNFTNLYVEEERRHLTFGGSLRIRIIDDIWLPIEIKYDPKNGNVFGFLNIRANFMGLGKVLKGSGS